MRRIMRELSELQTNPPEGIRVVTSEDNMLDVTGIIQGPGAFCGGLFVAVWHAADASGAQRARPTRVATSG